MNIDLLNQPATFADILVLRAELDSLAVEQIVLRESVAVAKIEIAGLRSRMADR